MDPIVPPKLGLEPTAPLQVRKAETQGADIAPPSKSADTAPEPRPDLEPGKLDVRIDVEAGRFVQTLTDAAGEETIRSYPSEAQLAYSRAVMAYLRALAES